MCQLLGMNCATPTDITFSFTGFAARGGLTDHHADGFGIGFYEDRAARCFIDNSPSSDSPIAALIKRYPIRSRNVIAHIRKATQGQVKLENCHPFVRERWGRHWLFAHNGDLKGFAPTLRGDHLPIGDTDSELAFCALLDHITQVFSAHEPDNQQLFDAVAALTPTVSRHGTFNFLLTNGRCLISHCSTQLYYLTRQWPFQAAHLIDEDVSVNFAQHTTPDDRVSVIATQPLTDNEVWSACAPGALLLFEAGRLVKQRLLPQPPTS